MSIVGRIINGIIFVNAIIPLTNKCIEALMRQKTLNTSAVQKYKDTKKPDKSIRHLKTNS